MRKNPRYSGFLCKSRITRAMSAVAVGFCIVLQIWA
jgi:hypothetical protein